MSNQLPPIEATCLCPDPSGFTDPLYTGSVHVTGSGDERFLGWPIYLSNRTNTDIVLNNVVLTGQFSAVSQSGEWHLPGQWTIPAKNRLKIESRDGKFNKLAIGSAKNGPAVFGYSVESEEGLIASNQLDVELNGTDLIQRGVEHPLQEPPNARDVLMERLDADKREDAALAVVIKTATDRKTALAAEIPALEATLKVLS